MTDWIPALIKFPGPRYLAFVSALEADIAAGRVKPGMRLLPQRDMAQRLDLSVGTISKAYAEAEQRGLISGEVGRGTFVQRRRSEARGLGPSEATINLALNVPPYTGEDEVIGSALAEIVADGEMSNLLGYLPHQGLRRHREAMVTWLTSLGVTADPDHLFITHGGQHALSIALPMVASPVGYRADGKLHLFGHARALGAVRLPAARRCDRRARVSFPSISTAPSPRPGHACSIACRRCRRRWDR